MGCARKRLANLIQHLVALVEDEKLDGPQTELLVANQSIQAARGRNDDVRMRLLVGQHLLVLLDVGSAIEDGRLDLRHVFGEAVIFVLDLEGQLTSVAHDEDRGFSGDGVDLLQCRDDKDRGLSEPRLGLAEHIGADNGLWDADLLDCSQDDVRAGSEQALCMSERVVQSERPSIRACTR